MINVVIAHSQSRIGEKLKKMNIPAFIIITKLIKLAGIGLLLPLTHELRKPDAHLTKLSSVNWP
jgi:hypothetical protein